MDSDAYVLGRLVGLLLGGLCGLALPAAVIGFLVYRARTAPALVAGAAACPKCGGTSASPVSFTWWGGALGPKLLSHVECTSCRTGYNGKTGQLNTVGIAIYVVVSSVVALTLCAFLLVLFLMRF